MGLALPPWLVEAHNNVWVLGVYGIIFGGLLPMLVGRWWFGTQRRTKDGVDARSAADFFKGIREESEFDEVVGALAHAVEFSAHGRSSASVDTLEGKVKASLGEKKWADVLKYAEAQNDAQRKKALVLLYAHLLRIPLENSALENGAFPTNCSRTKSNFFAMK
jgi:translocation protein SEC63